MCVCKNREKLLKLCFLEIQTKEKKKTTSLPVVSLKDITRCQSKNSKSWIYLTVCVQGLCLQSCPKHVPIFALSVLVPGCGWGPELLGCNPALPAQRKRKKSLTWTFWQLFVSKRTALCLLLAALWFSWMWRWPGFPNPCPCQAASQSLSSHTYLPLIPWSCAEFGPRLSFWLCI